MAPSALDEFAQDLLGSIAFPRIFLFGDGARLSPQLEAEQAILQRVQALIH